MMQKTGWWGTFTPPFTGIQGTCCLMSRYQSEYSEYSEHTEVTVSIRDKINIAIKLDLNCIHQNPYPKPSSTLRTSPYVIFHRYSSQTPLLLHTHFTHNLIMSYHICHSSINLIPAYLPPHSEHRRIDHGVINKFQFTSHLDLGYIMRTEFRWDYNDQFLKPGTYCWSLFCNRGLYISTVQVSPINYYPER